MSHRINSALPSSKKTHSEQHKQIFRQLLKESANKTCADCKTATHPRWASWNIGCFVCIRCSGIHRSMGTHISKVKSVDLDAWTDEQVELMVKWGNERANKYWEDKLPDGYIPDQLKIDNFIRTKYDLKKWVLSSTIPNPLSLNTSSNSNATKIMAEEELPSTNNSKGNTLGATSGKTHKESPLLDDEFGLFTLSPSTTSLSSNNNKSVKTVSPVPVVAPRTTHQQAKAPTQILSRNSTGDSLTGHQSGRPDLKKSILSLYSSPSSSSSFVPQQNKSHTSSNIPVNSLSSSLYSLNFNDSSTIASQNRNQNQSPISLPGTLSNSQRVQTQGNPQASVPSWGNEWSDSTTSIPEQWPTNGNYTTQTSTFKINNLDDDLFKNAWK